MADADLSVLVAGLGQEVEAAEGLGQGAQVREAARQVLRD